MEEQFNFQIDFENMSTTIPIVETPQNEESQQTNIRTEIMQEGKKVYICTVPDCGKAFKFLSQATRHSIIHQGDRPFPCTFQGCDKAFKRADVLEKHMQLHNSTENLPYACDRPGCDRKFASKPALNYHQVRHENNRSFKCDSQGCGKTFLLASQLKQHKKIHTDDPPSGSTVEGYNPDPELQREFAGLCSSPVEQAEWRVMNQKCKSRLSDDTFQENLRMIFNSLIIENRILKETGLKERQDDKKSSKAKENLAFCSTGINFCTTLTRLTEHFDSEELKLLEFLKQKGDDDF